MSKTYYPQIDGLRFVAIMLVLVEHFATFIGSKIHAGYYGVDLFFVISGFLITGILLKSKGSFGHSYKNFLGRRTLRIFPIYYLAIAILYALQYEPIMQYGIYCITYTYNYALVYYNIPINAINHFWSLAVEEQFYLFWPFVILALRNNARVLAAAFGIIILLCSAQTAFDIFPSYSAYNWTGLYPRANSLVIGAMGALLFYKGKVPQPLLQHKGLEYLSIAALIICMAIGGIANIFIFPYVSLYLILKASTGGFATKAINKFLSSEKIIYIGSISYGIYVYHMPVDYYMTKYFFDPYCWNIIPWKHMGTFSVVQWHPWLVKFPLYTAISIGIAHLSFVYIEKPILRLKDRFF